MELKHYCHLLKRATLSVAPKQLTDMPNSRKEAVGMIFLNAEKTTELKIEYRKRNLHYKKLSPEQRKQEQKYNRKMLQEYNTAWFRHMCKEADNLRERMVFFWTNHFVATSRSIQFTDSYNNTIRKHALGDFKELTIAIAKEAAMIQYLDNNKNNKRSPNENFARELMELFTLGRDILYSESDIKEAAKAFTGWKAKKDGEFFIAKRKHDEGVKKFLGKTGNFSGEDIISIILGHRECAEHICKRIYREFVNIKINSKHVKELTDVFYPNYSIKELMQYLFMADWFYDEQNIATKIKSPIELLISLHQLVPFQFEKQKQFISLQRNLGQILLFPPNVAGWPGGLQWIDSSTLMLRLRLPSLLLNGGQIDDEGESIDMQQRKRKKSRLKMIVDANAIANLKSLAETQRHLLLYGKEPQEEVADLLFDSNSTERIVKMLSIPDFQMC